MVVGAGPTGLLLAFELARRKIDVKVIEKHSSRQEISKALVLQARTLEVMDLCGLGEEFLARGYPAPGLNIGLHGSAGVAVDLRQLKTRYPFLLVLPQNDTEEILERRLADEGVTIIRGCELLSLNQNENAIESVARSNGTEKITFSSAYVVGCDGAHSSVRTAAGIPFEGEDLDWTVFLADVKLDASFIRTRITNFTAHRGFVSVLPFLGEFSRIFAVDFEKQQIPVTEELRLTDLQDTIDAILPSKVTLSEPRWITRFRSPSRQAPSMRSGRVLLAGDAAHAHTPAGGQGMNSGLQDAHDLSWRLAAVVQGRSSVSLLDEYSEERTTVNRKTQRNTDQMFRSFVLTNPVLKMGRDLLLRSSLPIPPIQRAVAEELSNIGVQYSFTEESRRQDRRGESLKTAIRPGQRIPDADLWAPGEPHLRLYELLRSPSFHLCIYVSVNRLHAEWNGLRELLDNITETLGAECRSTVILDEGLPAEVNLGAKVVIDYKGQFAAITRASTGSVFLIRPDGYLAFRIDEWQLTDAMERITGWIRRRDRPTELARKSA